MSDSSAHAIELGRLTTLRGRAASRLTGAAAGKGAPARAADALTVLHALASKPETAADALTLLHELQVHQVELDLQAQEMLESRAELESALRRQIELYDFQPLGCFTIDAQMVVHELNQTGAEMLGLGRDEAFGVPLDRFFGVESARRLRSGVLECESGARSGSYRLTLCPPSGSEMSVVARVAKDPAAGQYLVSLVDLGDDQQCREGVA
jgi:PAS domain-containing protein